MASGLGTPVGAALGATLCTEKDAVTVGDPGTQTDDAGAVVDLTLASQDSERHQLTFTASGLPVGLTINASTGAITGQLPTTAGAYAVTVTATAAITGASAHADVCVGCRHDDDRGSLLPLPHTVRAD